MKKEKEIKIMINEGKFLDIYNKYGKGKYKKHLPRMVYDDVYNETNNKFLALCKETKYILTRQASIIALKSIIYLNLIGCAGCGLIMNISQNEIRNNSKKYEKEIDKYNEHIYSYAEEIKKLKLNDFETIMKVMYDEWNYIDGYGLGKIDAKGYYRLDLTDPNNAGVCRNIADDVTAKLNAINPEYQAENLIVCMEAGNWTICDISIRHASDYSANNITMNNQNSQNIWGNHLITVAKIPNTNILLTIDPTNPSIGILRGGKIYTFSTPDGNGLEEPIIGNIMYGYSHYIDTIVRNVESFKLCDYNIQELKEQYGIEAQNKILEKIKTK